jgi:hypothetical protein
MKILTISKNTNSWLKVHVLLEDNPITPPSPQKQKQNKKTLENKNKLLRPNIFQNVHAEDGTK